MTIKCYKDLGIWQASIQLVTGIYRVTTCFPKDEASGLTSQIRRAAVSIPSNIAEGHARSTNKEFNHFLAIALGSLAEQETQLVIAGNLDYLPENDKNSLLDSCDVLGKQIRKMKQSVAGSL